MNRLVLIADDEPDVLSLVSSHFKAAGYQTVQAENGTGALTLVRERLPSVAILDLMMPEMTGLEVLRAVKNNPRTADIPVVLLTASVTETDRVVAFELGADDYVAKPFSPRELVLRVRGILRHRAATPIDSGVYESGDLELDMERHVAKVHGAPVDLTAIEFKLLAALMARAGRVQTREGLLTTVWEAEHEVESRTVDTHVRRLREKLGPVGEQIRTVRKIGYRLDAS